MNPTVIQAIPGGLIFAAGFLGIVAYMAIIRAVESRRIEKKFERDRIIITSFGVNFFGQESEPGGLLRSVGALVLLRDGLYYHARFADRELLITKSAITGMGLTNAFKHKSLHQNTVVISFKNEEGKPDRAVFRIPRPAQWMEAIKMNLLT
jgi:hypothetical protein